MVNDPGDAILGELTSISLGIPRRMSKDWESRQSLSFDISQFSDSVEEIDEIFPAWFILAWLLKTTLFFLMEWDYDQYLCQKTQRLFKCMNPKYFSQQSPKPKSSNKHVEEGWGLTYKRMFQNLLRVLHCPAYPSHVCANKTGLFLSTIHDGRSVSIAEVKTKKGEIWNLLSWGEGNGTYVIYIEKAKWSPVLQEKS